MPVAFGRGYGGCHGGWPLRAVRDGSPYRDASPLAMAPFLRTPAGMASDDRVSLGKAGEDAACRELCRRGYAIVARRFRTREGEIDIIARDGETLVFVEVKARRSERRGTASEAVGRHKQMRLARIALCYLHVTAAVGQRCRFDVVSVHYAPGAEAPVVQVIQGAFEAESAT